MRVLQINKFFFEKGGTERYLFALSRQLQEREHEVSFFSMHHPRNVDSPYSQYFVSQADYDVSFPALERIPRSLSFIRSREAARNLRRLIAAERPDVAHLHNIYHQITPSIIPVLRRADIPIVMTLHDYKLICPNYLLFDGRSYCFRCRGGRFFHASLARCNVGSLARSTLLAVEAYWQKVTRVYGAVRLFLAPSRHIRERYMGEGFSGDRIRYLPAFIEPDDDAKSGETGGDGVEGLPDRYILYFGRLSAEKGLHTLLEAVQQLGEVPLVVAGDGPLRPALEAAAAERGLTQVHFTGHLERSVLAGVIGRANCVVLPTESPENAPFTVLEAMAAGVALVVSDMGGLPELAERVDGPVFRAGDAAALAGAIRALWEDPARARVLGDRGRDVIRSEFSPGRHVGEIESVYASVTKRGSQVDE